MLTFFYLYIFKRDIVGTFMLTCSWENTEEKMTVFFFVLFKIIWPPSTFSLCLEIVKCSTFTTFFCFANPST